MKGLNRMILGEWPVAVSFAITASSIRMASSWEAGGFLTIEDAAEGVQRERAISIIEGYGFPIH